MTTCAQRDTIKRVYLLQNVLAPNTCARGTTRITLLRGRWRQQRICTTKNKNKNKNIDSKKMAKKKRITVNHNTTLIQMQRIFRMLKKYYLHRTYI